MAAQDTTNSPDQPLGQRSDRAGGAVWLALGLAMVIGAWRMDRFESMGATVYTAPGLVPGIYGVLLMLLGGVLAWRGWRAAGSDATRDPLLNRRILLMLALTLGYAALGVGRLPFGPLTAVFVVAFCWLFDERPAGWARAKSALLVGVGCAVVVVLVFERVFLVRLP